jgi:hypothetical protein
LIYIYNEKFKLDVLVHLYLDINFLQPTCKSDMCPLSMWESHIFFINAIKKNMWEAYAIKTTCVSHMPRDICHFYMWVVGYFLQTDL